MISLLYHINIQVICVLVFCIKGVLKNFAKLTRKYMRWSLFFGKVTLLRAATSS